MLNALAAVVGFFKQRGGLFADPVSGDVEQRSLHQTPADRIDCEMERIKNVLGDIERGNALEELTAKSERP